MRAKTTDNQHHQKEASGGTFECRTESQMMEHFNQIFYGSNPDPKPWLEQFWGFRRREIIMGMDFGHSEDHPRLNGLTPTDIIIDEFK
jgi:hypothetical protein